jgi:hypothetical protein
MMSVMKEFRCLKCNVYLGEMEKGKIHKKAVILCTECHDAYKVYETLAGEKYGNKSGSGNMPKGFEEIFGGSLSDRGM